MASSAIFFYIGRQPELKVRVPEFTTLMLLAGLIYLVAVYIVGQFPFPRAAIVVILFGALIFRLAVIRLQPQLSDDVYRYQWEGRIQRAGINPYTVYPAIAGLRRFEDPAHPLTTGQYTPTVYPPLAEKTFSWVRTVSAYKRLFTALDLASVGILLLTLAAQGQPAQRILIYAWNPTVIVSFAMCGHQDSLAIFTVLVATLLMIARRPAVSAVFLALSVLSKFFAVLLVPLFYALLASQTRKQASDSAQEGAAETTAQASGSSRASLNRFSPRSIFAFTFAGTIALGYLPYVRAGRHVLGGLGNYAAVWEANDSIFRLMRAAGNSQSQAELVAGVGLLGLLVSVMRGSRKLAKSEFVSRHSRLQVSPASLAVRRNCDSYLLRGALVLTAGLLLFSPTAFPWYFTWTIPFLCFYPNAPWLLMSVTAILGYAPVTAYAAGQPYLHSPLILTLEYGPVLAWFAWTAIQRSRALSTDESA